MNSSTLAVGATRPGPDSRVIVVRFAQMVFVDAGPSRRYHVVHPCRAPRLDAGRARRPALGDRHAGGLASLREATSDGKPRSGTRWMSVFGPVL
jgi:hypothetical protein